MHDLDTTYGLDNAISYVGDTPWHRYGTRIPEGLSVSDAIATCPAVNFNTLTVPFHYLRDRPYSGGKFRVIIRDDTNAPLGVATERYSPIQTRDMWRGLDPLIDAGLASIETLGSIAGGRKVWGMVRINATRIDAWESLQQMVGEIQPYAMAVDFKDASRSAIISANSVRVVCQNTLHSALGNSQRSAKIPHTGDTEQKVKDAADQMWGELVRTYTALAADYATLATTRLTGRQFERLVLNPVATIPMDASQFKSDATFEAARQRAARKRASVSERWVSGIGHTGDGSAWEAYNGLVEALDHNVDGTFATPKDPIASLTDGAAARIKATVANNLLALAGTVN